MIPVADGVLFRVDVAGVRKSFARIEKSADRSTMYTVRQAARKVGQYSRRGAPVYRGKPRDRYVGGKSVGPMLKGDLKKSIRSQKRLKRVPGGYAVTVGPRGIANVYAAAQEARRPFMAPAKAQVEGEIQSIAETAWGRSMRRG